MSWTDYRLNWNMVYRRVKLFYVLNGRIVCHTLLLEEITNKDISILINIGNAGRRIIIIAFDLYSQHYNLIKQKTYSCFIQT